MIVRRLLICASLAGLALTTTACGRVEAEQHAASRTLLNVPHHRQETLLCVPTSASMVLAFYGETQDPRRLKALADGQDYTPGQPFTDHSITLYKDLITGLHTLGYWWEEQDLPNTADGFAKGIGIIETEVAAGRPVLVDATLPSGHTFVIRGFDHGKKELYIVDPNRPQPGRATVTYDQFAAVWNERAYGGDFRSLILTRPKTA